MRGLLGGSAFDVYLQVEKWIRKAIKGNRKAQAELYQYCFRFLMPVCNRYKINERDALTVLNTSFMKILDSKRVFSNENEFVHWAKRVTINTLIDDYRKTQRRKKIEFSAALNDWDIDRKTFNEAESKLSVEELLNMVKHLPEPTRTIFNLFAVDGYQHREISEKLEIPEGTSKWHLFKARKILREQIEATLYYELIEGHG